ncbi:MAG: arylsulfatase [Verrucomicrobiota bacterium]
MMLNDRTNTVHFSWNSRIMRSLIPALIVVTLLSLAGAKLSAANKPNIIFILADDLGYGEVGAYGQEKILTPSLDKMAAGGMRFTHHFAGGAVCGPSRACLMTGQSQAIGFVKGNPGGQPARENLRDQDVTVAEILKSAGYATACIGKWGLGPQGESGYPLNQGFDYFLGYDTHVAAHNYYPASLCENKDQRQLSGNSGDKKRVGKVYTHDVFTEQALEFIGEKREQPYFLYLAYAIPHSPYNPPDIEPYQDKDWSTTNKKYAAMITRMDRDIGRVLDLVKKSEKDTLVIFTSDNGPQSGGSTESQITRFFDSNGEQKGIKRDMYNGGIRVPFIAWWPGKIEADSVSKHISSFQDFLPTVCEITESQIEVTTDGLSYLPTLLGKYGVQAEHEWLYWEFLYMSKKGIAGRQAVLNPKLGFKAVRFGRNAPVELYRFEEDIAETNDVAKQFPEIANQMSSYLDSCRSESKLWPISYHDKPHASTFSPHYKKGDRN